MGSFIRGSLLKEFRSGILAGSEYSGNGKGKSNSQRQGGCLLLRQGFGSRSFADMRVEAVGEMPRRTGRGGNVAGEPGAGLAIKSFLAAIDSDDSLFCVAQPLVEPAADEAAGHVYSADIVLEFREAEHSRSRSLHFVLIEKLIELLKEAGSNESLEATLCLTSGSILVGGSGSSDRSAQKELALWIRLAAKGVSSEQAVLRWGLGLAHLQQALLFTSRHLRMHLGQAGG
jgi:hypothetical protein